MYPDAPDMIYNQFTRSWAENWNCRNARQTSRTGCLAGSEKRATSPGVRGDSRAMPCEVRLGMNYPVLLSTTVVRDLTCNPHCSDSCDSACVSRNPWNGCRYIGWTLAACWPNWWLHPFVGLLVSRSNRETARKLQMPNSNVCDSRAVYQVPAAAHSGKSAHDGSDGMSARAHCCW